MNTKRNWTDAATAERCRYVITLRDGSTADCGRGRVIDGYCRQHDKMMRCKKCGGRTVKRETGEGHFVAVLHEANNALECAPLDLEKIIR